MSAIGRQLARRSSSLATAASRSMAPSAQHRLKMVSRHLSTSSATPSSSGGASNGSSEAPVLFEAIHSLRKMTLNRPKALNTLNDEMISLITPQLKRWEESDLANVILFKGNGRSFCAGGDVVSLVKQLDVPENWSKSTEFFSKEYGLDNYIAKMSTPIITLMTGDTLGGGVGLSVHAPFRVATESTKFAMPETTIGLFPDVGANFFLGRMDGALGVYLALTSNRLTGLEVYQAGIATHFVPGERLADMEARLAELSSDATVEEVNSALNEFAADEEELRGSAYDLVGSKRKAVDLIFGRQKAEEIVADLQKLEEGTYDLSKLEVPGGGEVDGPKLAEWAKKTRETILFRSPTSVKVTLAAIREGRKLNIDEAFQLDMRLAATCCNPDVHPDFKTGVTHLLINKDRSTRAAWSPSTLEEVSSSSIQSNFFSAKVPFSNPSLPVLPQVQGKAYTSYPHAHYALPSEQAIQDVITGEAKGSGSYALTEEEVVKKFLKRSGEKVGVKEKIREVVARRCKIGEENTLKWIR